jgi:hypothetical protein
MGHPVAVLSSRINRRKAKDTPKVGTRLKWGTGQMGCVAFLNLYPNLLQVETGMVMVVVMMVVNYHHDLRLRRIGYCEAEDEDQSEQKLFHT